ncbi:MAG: LacI family DNA-binding transcriptional regulator [Anaerolineales bacterium]|nr:LacI family DNA-binding transcriptional regulator [Anaerolineales bacterium]
MSEIAELAGVSIATVSRVLHNTDTVSEDTRRQVEDAIQTLGYRVRRRPRPSIPKPDPEKIVLLFTTDIVNPFFAEVIRGTQEEIELQEHPKHALSIMHLTNACEELVQAARQMSALGIILTGAYPFPELLKFQEASKIPLVVINYRITGPRVSCIIVDFKDAYFRATRHLIDLGHRRIGFVDDTGHSEIGVARLDGYKNALTEAGIPYRPELYTSIAADARISGGFQATSHLLALPPNERPTAILAFNDLFALGVMHSIRAHGLRVPEDVSVIGCDDIPMAAYAYPPVTTISQPKYRIGKLAVLTLLKMQQDPPEQMGSFTLMESPLIIRESTARCSEA